jgi:hypothetical protein
VHPVAAVVGGAYEIGAGDQPFEVALFVDDDEAADISRAMVLRLASRVIVQTPNRLACMTDSVRIGMGSPPRMMNEDNGRIVTQTGKFSAMARKG